MLAHFETPRNMRTIGLPQAHRLHISTAAELVYLATTIHLPVCQGILPEFPEFTVLFWMANIAPQTQWIRIISMLYGDYLWWPGRHPPQRVGFGVAIVKGRQGLDLCPCCSLRYDGMLHVDEPLQCTGRLWVISLHGPHSCKRDLTNS
jgi:hypothetical protein